jgi:hypothetical protein
MISMFQVVYVPGSKRYVSGSKSYVSGLEA